MGIVPRQQDGQRIVTHLAGDPVRGLPAFEQQREEILTIVAGRPMLNDEAVDHRGEPLTMPPDAARRREQRYQGIRRGARRFQGVADLGGQWLDVGAEERLPDDRQRQGARLRGDVDDLGGCQRSRKRAAWATIVSA